MNELEFKRHLKDLVHGHHHPEEHDWHQQVERSTEARAASRTRAKKGGQTKRSKRK